MKATKAVKINENMVGVEVMNIQDVVKAQAAGLELEDKDESSWSCSCKDSIMFDELLITESELES